MNTIPANLPARMRDLTDEKLREVIADGEAAQFRRDYDASSKALRATFALVARVEQVRREKARRATCSVCQTALVAGGCPLCESKRAIGLVQKRCVTCLDLFTHDELFDLIKCDSCTSKEIRRTSRLIHHLGLREAA